MSQALGAGMKDVEERTREMDLLTYQIEEIEREKIGEGEEEGIKERLKVLRDAGAIKAAWRLSSKVSTGTSNRSMLLWACLRRAPAALFRHCVDGRAPKEKIQAAHLRRRGYRRIHQGCRKDARL